MRSLSGDVGRWIGIDAAAPTTKARGDRLLVVVFHEVPNIVVDRSRADVASADSQDGW